MGWWAGEGGSVIGDRPVDIFGALLDQSMGDRFDVELFGGVLAAFGAALLRNPGELVSDPPASGSAILAEFDDGPPLVVPIAPGVIATGLDEAVFDALESAVFHYRETGPERLPRLAELLETLAFAARGRIVATDGRGPLTLRRIRPRAHAERPPDLDGADWRSRMAALVVAGRLRMEELAPLAQGADIPPLSVGLRDEDRRALLALRDLAAARARGIAIQRPVHPDPEIAAKRAALLADVEAAVDGVALPGPESAAYVLSALLDPESVRRSGIVPPEWRRWLWEE